ncbi:Mbov_0400 family ICE element protein [Mycoplasma sp. Z1473D]
MDDLKVIRKLKDNKYTSINETIVFDDIGFLISPHSKGNNARPLIIFTIKEYTYYLKVRGKKEEIKKMPFEIEISLKDDNNHKLKKSSWVDTANIQIMKTTDFHKIFRNSQFNTIKDLSFQKQLEIISSIYNNLSKNKSTLQEVAFDKNFKVYSNLIKNRNSNNIFDVEKYNLYKDVILNTFAFKILDEANAWELFNAFANKNSIYHMQDLTEKIDISLKENGIFTEYRDIIASFKNLFFQDWKQWNSPYVKIDQNTSQVTKLSATEYVDFINKLTDILAKHNFDINCSEAIKNGEINIDDYRNIKLNHIDEANETTQKTEEIDTLSQEDEKLVEKINDIVEDKNIDKDIIEINEEDETEEETSTIKM